MPATAPRTQNSTELAASRPGQPRLSPWPRRACPHCHRAVSGGPVRFRCDTCETGLAAADLQPAEGASPS